MASRKRKSVKAASYTTVGGGCKFGKVKRGSRKGQCRKRKVSRKR